MAEIKDQKSIYHIVNEVAARMEEDLASLYSNFMAKLVKAQPGTQSMVIEEYIGNRFDVRARWFLSVVRDEKDAQRYLEILDTLREKDVEPLIRHFASSLPYREMVDARIIGRISYWKSEAMRRVRENAQRWRVGRVASPDRTAGTSDLGSSGTAATHVAPSEVNSSVDHADETEQPLASGESKRRRGPPADAEGHKRIAKLLPDDWERDIPASLKRLDPPADGGPPILPSAAWCKKYGIASYSDVHETIGDEEIRKHLERRRTLGRELLTRVEKPR